MRVLKYLAALILTFLASISTADASNVYQNYIYGDIKDITSIRGALLVRMDDDKVPTICNGTASPWMMISQNETAMVSVVLTYWSQGKKRFALYSDGMEGYCKITQADPEN